MEQSRQPKESREFCSALDKEISETQKRKGGPQTEFQRNQRLDQVCKLYFEYGYSAVKIAEMLNVNRNTINSDIKDLYSTFQSNWENTSTVSILQNHVFSLMAQKSRLREGIDSAKNLSEKLAIEKMILQVETRLHQFQLMRGQSYDLKAVRICYGRNE